MLNRENSFLTPIDFAEKLKEAFGKNVSLPIAFFYSDEAITKTPKSPGCLFKQIAIARRGEKVTLHKDNISCGGGKFYTRFSLMPKHVPHFVSCQEKYKASESLVLSHIKKYDIGLSQKPYLNFLRIDKLDSFDPIEGILFLSSIDQISGLVSWAMYDSNDEGAITVPFGSGCSTLILMTIRENLLSGKKVFLGGFDPSVRPYLGKDELGLSIPKSRFNDMMGTLSSCCLFGTNAWERVKQRM